MSRKEFRCRVDSISNVKMKTDLMQKLQQQQQQQKAPWSDESGVYLCYEEHKKNVLPVARLKLTHTDSFIFIYTFELKLFLHSPRSDLRSFFGILLFVLAFEAN